MTTKYQHKVSFDADFKGMVRSAQQASHKLEDLFSQAFKFKKADRRILEIHRLNQTLAGKEAKLRSAIEKKLYRQRTIDQKRDAEERIRLDKEIEEKKRKLQDQTLSDEEKKRERMELRLAEERLELFKESADAFTDGLRESYKELDHVVHELQEAERDIARIVNLQNRSTEAMGKMRRAVVGDMLKGGEEFGEHLEDLFSHLGDKLTGSIDPAAIAKAVGAGLGKGFSRLGDVLGPSIGKGGAMAFGAIGALVTILGTLAGVVLDTDKKMKDFNKSAVQTYGSLELARLGSGNLGKGLRILNHTVTDLGSNLGVSEQDALALFDTLDKGGFTLDRITRGTQDAALAQARLNRELTNLYRVASATGVGLAEYTQNLTDYSNDLGQSLDTVNDSFATIADMANRASFGTRRFYSMVIQASSGQASLNTRLDDTAELLMRMTKVLGAKKATEMVGQHAGDMQSMGTQDRYRMIMTTGSGRFRKNLAQDAQHQARGFAQDASNPASQGALGAALSESGLGPELARAIQAAGGSNADPQATQNLVRQLAQMNSQQQSSLVAAVTSRDDGLGRRLGQLITVARGTNGGMSNMADAMSGMSSGGSIVARLQSAMAILGKPLNELTGVERMAAEQITGASGEQFEMLQKVAANAQGQFNILKSYTKKSLDPRQQADLAKRFGATVVNGQIRVARTNPDGSLGAVGEEISGSNQMITAYMERTGDTLENIRTEQSQLQYDTYDATVSVADILENKILYYVRALYEDVGQPIIEWLTKSLGLGTQEQRQAAKQGRELLTSSISTEQGTLSNANRTLAQKRTQFNSTTDTGARERLSAEIASLQKQVDTSRARIERMTGARTQLASGDFSSLTQHDTYTAEGGGTYKSLDQALADARKRTSTGSDVLSFMTAGSFGGGPEVTRGTGYGLNAALMAGGPAVPPTAVAPGAGAPVTLQPSPIDSNPTATSTTTTALTTTATAVTTAVTATAEETAQQMETQHREGQQNLRRILTRETKLGDALARSSLPDAIAQAQLKLQFQQMAYAAGMDPAQVASATADYMSQGTISQDLQTRIAASADPSLMANMHLFGIRSNELGTAQGRRFGSVGSTSRGSAATGEDPDPEGGDGDEAPAALVRRPHHDFVYQNRSGAPTITPIDREDQVVGSRPGGALDRAGGRGGTYTVNIYGGDTREVYATVRKVLGAVGITPNRVTSGG